MPSIPEAASTIAFVQRHPDSGHGGEERSLFNIMRARAASGKKDVLVFQERGDFVNALEKLGVRTVPSKVGEFQTSTLLSGLLSAIRTGAVLKKEGVTIIHANHYKDIAWCAVAAKFAGAQLSLHLRLNAPKYLSRQYQWGLQQTGRFAANSAFVEKDWRKFLPTEKAVDVIWNGLPLESWPVKKAEKRKKGQPVVIGFIGRIVYEKGFHLLITALDGLNFPWTLKIAGSDRHSIARGESDYLKRIRAQIAAAGWERRVEFLGHVTAPETFFNQIDVLVTPSYHDAFGRTFMEGVCAGVPVIAAAAGAMPEVAEKLPQQKKLLFNEGDAASLQHVLNAFVTDDAFDAQAYAHQGRTLFDVRRTVSEMDTFFRRMEAQK